jgi:lipopolysaccharide transport system permease protein
MSARTASARLHRFSFTEIPGSLLGLAAYRELLWLMTRRQFKLLYRQSFLGYAWALINPLSQVLILTFVFSEVLGIERSSGGDEPYAIHLFCGLLPWIFFASALNTGVESIATGGALVTRVYFPRELLTLASTLTRLVDLVFGAVVFAALLVIYGEFPTATALWAPLIFAAQLVFTFGLALPLAALNVFVRDVRFLVGVSVYLLFFLTPVIYGSDTVPERYQWIYDLNPMASFIDAYRGAILDDTSPAPDRLILAALIAVATLLVGYFIFKKLEPSFAERV